MIWIRERVILYRTLISAHHCAYDDKPPRRIMLPEEDRDIEEISPKGPDGKVSQTWGGQLDSADKVV